MSIEYCRHVMPRLAAFMVRRQLSQQQIAGEMSIPPDIGVNGRNRV
jgi:hypothetical protein